MSEHGVRLADVCVAAIADCFRGDGEIVANPIGTIPMIGGRLARATFEPDLMMTDGEAFLVADDRAFFEPNDARTIEYYNPYRSMFDIVWSGRRHVIMGASQIDPFGNQNFAAIGADYHKPKVQLLGFRGAPGNTVNHVTSYWIPNHSTNVFVPKVDVVCGVGYDRAATLGDSALGYELRRVITNLCVLDFEPADHRMRLRSLHPGVTIDEVVAATGFELVIPDSIDETRLPSDDELRLVDDVIDPDGARYNEVKG
ncbi:MAG TPA: CoA-transferase [Acidimicrobiales bacterium]|nr:CoA-transferase [Acidimicrobiales bacterium]